MMNYKGPFCYNNPHCSTSFIIPEALLAQIRLETRANDALKDLRYHLKMKVHPHVIMPRRKVTTFPMRREVFEALFPTARKFNPCKRTDKPLTYMSSGKLYEIELTTDEMEALIGPEWYFTYGGADVAVHVGSIYIRLIEHKLTEYKTTLNMSWPTVIKDSATKDVHYFCRAEFSYRKLTRWDRSQRGMKGVRPDTGVWKIRANELRAIKYKKVRVARVLKKVAKVVNKQAQ